MWRFFLSIQLFIIFYRYKHVHALKWQTVSWPNGMIGDMWGPISGRLSDLDTLRLSQINTRLRDLQAGQEDQFKLYGDAIYPVMTHLRKRHQNRPNTAAQIRENNVMKKLRITIEWDYGNTINLFKYVNFHENGKVLLAGGSNIAVCYFIASFLRNCHVCLYHCQTSKYYNVAPPALYYYLNQVMY